jgi:hypothetical protein
LGRNVEFEVIVSFGGLHAVQRAVLGTNSAFALGPRKTMNYPYLLNIRAVFLPLAQIGEYNTNMVNK